MRSRKCHNYYCTVQFTEETAESIVGQAVGRIVIGTQDSTPGNIRDGFIGCVKVSVFSIVVSLMLHRKYTAVLCRLLD